MSTDGRPRRPEEDHVTRHRARMERTHRAPPSQDTHRTMPSSTRNRSNDRYAVDSDDESQKGSRHPPAQGPNFFSNLLHSSRGATDGITKSGKGLFSKIARSGSGTVQDPSVTAMNPDNYVFRVIDLPLVEQTRITRIKKNLSGAGDKTEFWMPALAYRCIE